MAMEYYSFEKVLKELNMEEDELKRLVEEGELRAFRDEDKMKFKKSDITGYKPSEEPGVILPKEEKDLKPQASNNHMIIFPEAEEEAFMEDGSIIVPKEPAPEKKDISALLVGSLDDDEVLLVEDPRTQKERKEIIITEELELSLKKKNQITLSDYMKEGETSYQTALRFIGTTEQNFYATLDNITKDAKSSYPRKGLFSDRNRLTRNADFLERLDTQLEYFIIDRILKNQDQGKEANLTQPPELKVELYAGALRGKYKAGQEIDVLKSSPNKPETKASILGNYLAEKACR